VSLTKEGQHMVLTKAVNLNILDDYHFIVLFVKDRPVQYFLGAEVISSGQKIEGPGVTFGSFLKAFPIWVFADSLEQIEHIDTGTPKIIVRHFILVKALKSFSPLG
jgi:hypothetical protein